MVDDPQMEVIARRVWAVLFAITILFGIIKIISVGRAVIVILQTVLFLLYIFDLGILINKKGVLWEGTIFLYSFFLFLLSRIFLDYIGVKSMYNSDRFAWYTISEKTTAIILISYILFLIVFLLLIQLLNNEIFSFDGYVKYEFSELPELENNCEKILLVTLPVGIISALHVALTQNYLSNYIVTADGVSIINGIGFIAAFCIPVYLVTIPQKGTRKIIYALIITYYLAQSLQGARSTLILFLVSFLWYLAARGVVIKTRTIAILGIVVFALCLFIMYLRDGSAYFASEDNILVKVLYSAGGTHMVFANYIDYRNSIPNDISYYFLAGIIYPILRYFINPAAFTQGRNYTMAVASVSLDHKLMYTLASTSFANGRGFGSNCITEFWAFGGYFGVIAIGAIMLILFRIAEKKSYNNRIFFLIQFYMIQSAVWAPRATPLPSIISVGCTIIVYFALSAISFRGKVFIK